MVLRVVWVYASVRPGISASKNEANLGSRTAYASLSKEVYVGMFSDCSHGRISSHESMLQRKVSGARMPRSNPSDTLASGRVSV